MPNDTMPLAHLQPKVSLVLDEMITRPREKARACKTLTCDGNGFRVVRTVTEQTVTEQPYVIQNGYSPDELAGYGLLVTEHRGCWLIAWYPGDKPDIYDDPEISYVFDRNGSLIGYAPATDGPFIFCTKDARQRAIRSVIDYDEPVIRGYALYRDEDGRFWTDLPELGGVQVRSAKDLAKAEASVALQECFYDHGRFYDGNPYQGGMKVENTDGIPLTTMRAVA